MPAKDFYHDVVKRALIKDGWTITHDPYKIFIGPTKGYIDLGAEMIGAEKNKEKIAVEIKSFLGLSGLDQFEDALGQFLIYLLALQKEEPDRILYLAVPDTFFRNFFKDPFFMEVAKHYKVKMVIFEEDEEAIIKWIKLNDIR